MKNKSYNLNHLSRLYNSLWSAGANTYDHPVVCSILSDSLRLGDTMVTEAVIYDEEQYLQYRAL